MTADTTDLILTVSFLIAGFGFAWAVLRHHFNKE